LISFVRKYTTTCVLASLFGDTGWTRSPKRIVQPAPAWCWKFQVWCCCYDALKHSIEAAAAANTGDGMGCLWRPGRAGYKDSQAGDGRLQDVGDRLERGWGPCECSGCSRVHQRASSGIDRVREARRPARPLEPILWWFPRPSAWTKQDAATRIGRQQRLHVSSRDRLIRMWKLRRGCHRAAALTSAGHEPAARALLPSRAPPSVTRGQRTPPAGRPSQPPPEIFRCRRFPLRVASSLQESAAVVRASAASSARVCQHPHHRSDTVCCCGWQARFCRSSNNAVSLPHRCHFQSVRYRNVSGVPEKWPAEICRPRLQWLKFFTRNFWAVVGLAKNRCIFVPHLLQNIFYCCPFLQILFCAITRA